MSEEKLTHLKAIVFDWAGTTIDYGSCAPASVFQEIFRQRGVPITAAQAREPMGRAKRDHIAAIGAMPEVDAAWRAQFEGQAMTAEQIDEMYADFLPLQKATLGAHSQLIEGVPEMIAWCRSQGLKIGSTTGYTRELLDIVAAAAATQGYVPDCSLGVEDAPAGRPAPFLLHEAAKRMEVYPMWNIVKVDDTPVGIEAGRNAGCWTIGITRTGNCVGLSREEWAALDGEAQKRRIRHAAQTLESAGAHAVVESVADIAPVLYEFDRRLAAGLLPFA
ncbi:phosphonoacetaldehyde hydrolase [Aureliella helgolandensis]|uniref:phosphonoacetaldehyde hydrolase n=1 Tax=Aureliella helgolandensis TaxID=2527968 RepID=A0A518GGS7_9BACT|nr:phosphonoacetaldehyde hydrolase [Aureliella helgolandensis]QDV27801.1 Phosphonoacetaldehyde hydrolase [Aureliella helgolandensis]